MRVVHPSGETIGVVDAAGGPHVPLSLWPDDGCALTLSYKSGQPNLWRVHLGDSSSEQLTFQYTPVTFGALSPDARWLAYTGNQSRHLSNYDVSLLDLWSGDDLMLFRSVLGAQDVVRRWSDDGNTLIVESDAGGFVQPLVLDLISGAVEQVSPMPLEQRLQDVTPDRSRWCVLVSEDGEVRPSVVESADGSLPRSPRSRREAAIRGTTYWARFLHGFDRVLVFSSSYHSRTKVSVWEVASGRIANGGHLTDVPGRDGGDSSLPTHHWLVATDGARVPSLYHHPTSATELTRPAGAILLHGGPNDWSSHGYDLGVKTLTAAGLHVVAPNVRGSIGYGRVHRDSALGDWGGGDVLDVLAAQELLLQRGVSREDTLVLGHSYGGYLALMSAMLHPERFGGVSSWAGFVDLRRLFASSSVVRYLMRADMGDPEQRPHLWDERSPVNRVASLRCHVTILHGAADESVPVEQARLLRDTLVSSRRREGRDFSYYEYPVASHVARSAEEEVRTWKDAIRSFVEHRSAAAHPLSGASPL